MTPAEFLAMFATFEPAIQQLIVEGIQAIRAGTTAGGSEREAVDAARAVSEGTVDAMENAERGK